MSYELKENFFCGECGETSELEFTLDESPDEPNQLFQVGEVTCKHCEEEITVLAKLDLYFE